MGLYTRQQLLLLLALLAAAGLGLGVVHWRAAHPQIVERLEGLDREIAADRKSTRLNSSHGTLSRMPSSA